MRDKMDKIAVIDVGSNSTRLLIAGVNPEGEVKPLHTGLITTRLGEGINRGLLLPGAMERTVGAIADFKDLAGEWGVSGLVVSATSAVRDAANRRDFLESVKEKTGFELRVLSGPEEAFFSYYGVKKGLAGGPGRMAVVDIGGGSTEFTWPENGSLACGSARVGAVRMTEGGHRDEEILSLLMPLLGGVKKARPDNVVAVGGTATTLAAMDMKMIEYDPVRVHGYRLEKSRTELLLDTLIGAGAEGRKKIPGLQPARADIIVAGVRIILIIMEQLESSFITVSEADLLYGLASCYVKSVEIKNVIHYQ
ncbi:exopolyphosphatase [Desulfocucumis palustris]|uniref:Exopolyphosphatase n=1 Tax=Desulfocucumis palustris TaxID=1898651 RepID=A0A2L2XD43_9FIRM|nr:Ppx/GppA family phosphatase [Desulfocucumis palustris]GBF32146.1 exopolyphosphatase [Desulfocucumis palustris]